MNCCEINVLASEINEKNFNDSIYSKIIIEYLFYCEHCNCFANLSNDMIKAIIDRCNFPDLKRYILTNKKMYIDFKFHFKEIYNIILNSVSDIGDDYMFFNKLFDIIIKSNLRNEYINYLIKNRSDTLIIKSLIFNIINEENKIQLIFKSLRVLYLAICKQNNDEIMIFIDDMLNFIDVYFNKQWKQRSMVPLFILMNDMYDRNFSIGIEKNMILTFKEMNYLKFFEVMSKYYILPRKIFFLYDNSTKIYYDNRVNMSFIFSVIKYQYGFGFKVINVFSRACDETRYAIMKGIINNIELNELYLFIKEFSR